MSGKLPIWLFERREGSLRFGSARPLRLCLMRLDFGEQGPPAAWIGCIGRFNFGLGSGQGLEEGGFKLIWYRRRGRSIGIAWMVGGSPA